MTSASIIRKFNGLHDKTVSKQSVEKLLSEVNAFIKTKRVDSHGPEGEKIISIKERLSKLLPKVNGQDFKLRINPKVKVDSVHKKLSGDLSHLEKKYIKQDVHQLIKLKKKLYPNPDITSPKSPEEKLLDKVIAEKFSYINKRVGIKRKRKTFKHKSRGKKLSGLKRSTLHKVKNGVYEFISSNGDKYIATSTSKNKKTNFDITRNGKMIDNGAYKVTDIRKVIAREVNNVRKGLSGKKQIKRKNKVTDIHLIDKYKYLPGGPKVDKPEKGSSDYVLRQVMLKQMREERKQSKNKSSKNLSGVAYQYHEVDLGEYQKDYHKMFSDSIVQLHGLPGHGKTVHIMKVAQDRAARTKDNVLYVAREEYGRSVFDMKLKEHNIGHKNLRFRSDLDENDLKWATVIVLDSITALDITPEKMEKLYHKYPNRNWFLLLQSTKDGKFRGAQTWEHLVDIAGEVRDRKVILSKNRLDPDNKDKAAKLRMDSLVSEKTEAARIREKVKYEATKDKVKETL